MSLALTSAMALAMVMPTMKTPWADIAPDASRLSDASGAKTVLTLCTGGTLGTAMQEAGGAGFLSHVSYVSDDDGCPLFPLSDSQAASNLRDADAATFLAHDTASVALLGNVQSYDASELTPYQLNVASKSTGLSKEALAASAWHRLVPQRVHYADPRLGVESWVAATEYAEATPNPLAATNSELLRKLSSKQAELNLFASLLEGVPSDELLSSEVRPRLAWATHKHCPFPCPCPCAPPSTSSLCSALPPMGLTPSPAGHGRCSASTSSASTCAWRRWATRRRAALCGASASSCRHKTWRRRSHTL